MEHHKLNTKGIFKNKLVIQANEHPVSTVFYVHSRFSQEPVLLRNRSSAINRPIINNIPFQHLPAFSGTSFHSGRVTALGSPCLLNCGANAPSLSSLATLQHWFLWTLSQTIPSPPHRQLASGLPKNLSLAPRNRPSIPNMAAESP